MTDSTALGTYGFVDRICDPGGGSLDYDDLTAWVQERLSEHRDDVLREAEPLPRRGDQFEQWLKAQRDEFERGDSVWPVLDYLLDEYRLHADTGTPLDQHACEGGNVDDCAGCHDQQHPPIRSCHLDHVHDAHNWTAGDGNAYGCIGFPEAAK